MLISVIVLTKSDAERLLNGRDIDAFVKDLTGRLALLNSKFLIPSDSGRKTALASLFSFQLQEKGRVFIYISGWGVWGSCENLDLFYGYRRSHGESRELIEAPIHLFESSEDVAFVSILCMVLYFVWDAWVFDVEGKFALRISHDEWLEVRTADKLDAEECTHAFERYGLTPVGAPS